MNLVRVTFCFFWFQIVVSAQAFEKGEKLYLWHESTLITAQEEVILPIATEVVVLQNLGGSDGLRLFAKDWLSPRLVGQRIQVIASINGKDVTGEMLSVSLLPMRPPDRSWSMAGFWRTQLEIEDTRVKQSDTSVMRQVRFKTGELIEHSQSANIDGEHFYLPQIEFQQAILIASYFYEHEFTTKKSQIFEENSYWQMSNQNKRLSVKSLKKGSIIEYVQMYFDPNDESPSRINTPLAYQAPTQENPVDQAVAKATDETATVENIGDEALVNSVTSASKVEIDQEDTSPSTAAVASVLPPLPKISSQTQSEAQPQVFTQVEEPRHNQVQPQTQPQKQSEIPSVPPQPITHVLNSPTQSTEVSGASLPPPRAIQNQNVFQPPL